MAFIGSIGKALISAAPGIAPGPVSAVLRTLIDLAIDGNAQFTGARTLAGSELEKHQGNVETSINALMRHHITLAGTQGFVTNLGGIATAFVSMPVNLVGVAIIQGRLVASIAHLRGYDLGDDRVRAAILMCMLGRGAVEELVAKGELPSTPMGVATAPMSDGKLEQQIAERVLASLTTAGGSKKVVSMLGRKIPLVGGGFGFAADSYSTAAVGRYAREQFVNRRPAIGD